MRRVSALLLGSIFAVSFGGCTFSPGPAGSGVVATGGGARSGNPGTGGLGGHGISTGGGGNGEFGDAPTCGQHTYGTQNLPGNVLIVQDKSGSMANDFNDQMGCTGAMCKWPSMTTALNNVVMNTQGTVNWGITFFPTGNNGGNNNCTVTTTGAIAPAPNNAGAVAGAIAATGPSGRTPTRLAVNTAVTYMNTLTDPNPKFILLATDGQPNCGAGGANDDAGAIMAVANAYNNGAGIPVFVVGVGNVT